MPRPRWQTCPVRGLLHSSLVGCHDTRGYSAGPRNDRDKVIAESALSVGYGREVGLIMLIYIMAFAYAAVSPIILPFTLCFFTSSWVGFLLSLPVHASWSFKAA